MSNLVKNFTCCKHFCSLSLIYPSLGPVTLKKGTGKDRVVEMRGFKSLATAWVDMLILNMRNPPPTLPNLRPPSPFRLEDHMHYKKCEILHGVIMIHEYVKDPE